MILIGALVSVILIIGADCDINEGLKKDFFNIYKNIAVETREFQEKPVTPDNVTFYMFSKNNPDKYIKLNEENLDLLRNKKIVFFIHGWTNSRENEWYDDLKNAFLTTMPDYHIVQVDWHEPANQLYYVSSINTYDVGNIIGDLISKLQNNYGVNLKDVLLIGHSLGGQITGFIGKRIQKVTGQKLPRIIALDPAGPLFSPRPDGKSLNRTDAEIVEVLHTDGGTFGYDDPCGTIDFFANGGSSQPGCKRIDLLDLTSVGDPVICDHQRAYRYFVEAVLNPKEFVAKKCTNWDSYNKKKCETGEEVALGDISTRATGNFYFVTNKETPYSKKPTDSGLTSKLVSLIQH